MDGETRYGVPFHVGASVMYWNAELFEKYNLDYKSVDTWEEYTELGRQLKAASNGEVYLTSVDTNAIEWIWISMVQHGEDWTGGNAGVPNVQIESVKKMLEMQQQWVNEGIAMVTPGGHLDTEEGYSVVMNEKVASFPKALWYMDRFVRFMPQMQGKFDLTGIPVFEAGQKNCVGLGGTGTDALLHAKYVMRRKLKQPKGKKQPGRLSFLSIDTDARDLNDKQVGGICGALLTNLSAWFSGVWFDLNLVGGAFKKIANALPFVHAAELEKALFNGNFEGAVSHILPIILYSVLITVVAVFCFLVQMKKQ
jgi:hypothetical protein